MAEWMRSDTCTRTQHLPAAPGSVARSTFIPSEWRSEPMTCQLAPSSLLNQTVYVRASPSASPAFQVIWVVPVADHDSPPLG